MTHSYYFSPATSPFPRARPLPPQPAWGRSRPGPLARMALKAACLVPLLVLAFAFHALLG
ncbi:hypothetical protein [Roseixanthobacter glucoisosaccharinicivorans]|uniref:hypothetical protein n=1 Tax=Roseixanthobacter glucoisosaccharinicivorans TaxID=3119923 RepID=UPI00372CA270